MKAISNKYDFQDGGQEFPTISLSVYITLEPFDHILPILFVSPLYRINPLQRLMAK